MIQVAILAFDEVALFELSCAVEVFGLPRPEFKNWYQCQLVTFETPPLTTTMGLKLDCKQVRSLEKYNLIIVPSWPTTGKKASQVMKESLRKAQQNGQRIISFCSGAFLLAELGILDHRKATTHWKYAARFSEQFPDVFYVDDVLYCYDGQIGSSAGLDLSLEVVRQDFGHEIANKVARRLVISAHRKGGQTQFAETPIPTNKSHFTDALHWATCNLQSPISISQIASKANMSRRTFDRKFRTDFNISPKTWLTHQRLNLSKELLESKPNNIEEIAEMCGFETSATFRHHFRKELGISPTQFRS